MCRKLPCYCTNPSYNQLQQLVNDIVAGRITDLDEIADRAESAAKQLTDALVAMTQIVQTVNVSEGSIINLPDSNHDITLNLLTNGQQLEHVTVILPNNTDGRIGQRVFVNSNNQIMEVSFMSDFQVNNPSVMFSMGDNFVYYRNQPTIWSRITS